MRLWRISTFSNLSGEGGLLAPGRWHSRGRQIVYLADHPALALLETIVHLQVDAQDLPNDYKLLAVEVPDELTIEIVDISRLKTTWRTDLESSRRLGDEWADSRRKALLSVPSVIVPSAFNFVLNPSHPESKKVRVVNVTNIAFDPRLLK